MVMSVMFCFATSLVFAADYITYWVGGSTTGDPNLWNVADNWSPAGLSLQWMLKTVTRCAKDL